MLKKVLLTIIILFTFLPSCFAISNIVIQNTDKKDVIDRIVKVVSQSGQNYSIESVNEYGVNFIASASINNFLGMQVGTQQNKLSFTTVQDGNNVILTVNEIGTLYYNNGGMQTQPINNVLMERATLISIKQYFNDYYLFGYTPTEKKKDGGFVIGFVDKGSPFDIAGIKAGDIILSIDGVKVRKRKDEYFYGTLFDKFIQKESIFVIKQNGVEKTFKITPVLYKAEGNKI